MDDNYYKIIVVEDEDIIRNNIIKKIETMDNAFKVVGSAHNGISALNLIRTCSPDVVVTDIKMPVMDGLELISKALTDYPDMPFLVLSGYNDFEYAQKAVRLGVNDYLLKPLKTEDLKAALTKIKSKIDVKKHLAENDIISSNIKGTHLHNELPCYFENNQFALFLVCIGNLSNHITSNRNASLFNSLYGKYNWDTELSDILGSTARWWLIDEKSYNQKFLIISLNPGNTKSIDFIAKALKESLLRAVNPFPVNICIHENYILYNDIWSYAQKMRNILDQELILCVSSIIPCFERAEPGRVKPLLDANLQNKLNCFLKNGDRKNLKEELFSLFTTMEKLSFSQRMFESVLHQIINIFSLQNCDITEKQIHIFEHSINDFFVSSTDLSNNYEGLWLMIDEVLAANRPETENTMLLTDRIESFIKSNYTSPISIESIANTFNIDLSYMIKIFKKYTGETPLKFLIGLRIAEAKRLMSSHNELDIRRVSEMVGYTDQHYFSRIFKKSTGYSPTEYKEHIWNAPI